MPISSAAASGSSSPGSWTTIWFGGLLAELGLARAELVDPVADDLDRAVEILLGHLLAGWGLRLEDHLEAALEVEAEHRRAGDRERRDRPEQGDDEDDDEVVAAHGSRPESVGSRVRSGTAAEDAPALLLAHRGRRRRRPRARPPRPAPGTRPRAPSSGRLLVDVSGGTMLGDRLAGDLDVHVLGDLEHDLVVRAPRRRRRRSRRS